MTYYIGSGVENGGTGGSPRFFYGIKVTDDDHVAIVKLDNLVGIESIDVNIPGSSDGTWDEFEYGVDFFDGKISPEHTRPYENLAYDQYRWDDRSVYYYINAEGELVVRTNSSYNYSEGVTQYVLPETLLSGDPIDLGSIVSPNPLENVTIATLSTINDIETASYAIDMGSIV